MILRKYPVNYIYIYVFNKSQQFNNSALGILLLVVYGSDCLAMKKGFVNLLWIFLFEYSMNTYPLLWGNFAQHRIIDTIKHDLIGLKHKQWKNRFIFFVGIGSIQEICQTWFMAYSI